MTSKTPMAGTRSRLVLLHGLASSPKEFGFLVHPLRRQGIELIAPEVPGYSAGQLSPSPRAQHWVAAASKVVREIADASSEPIGLGGLCTGGMLAAAVAASGMLAQKLSGLAILSPPVACDGWGLPWWYRLRHGAYGLGISGLFAMTERSPYGLKNERIREFIRRQLEHDGNSGVGPLRVPLKNIREGERLARRFADNVLAVNLPLLVQHAREDEVCSLGSVQSVLARIPSSRYTLRVLDNSYHMITADNDRHVVAAQLVDFMRKCSGVRRPETVEQTDSAFPSPGVAASVLASQVRQLQPLFEQVG
jgi:carboxylesterase